MKGLFRVGFALQLSLVVALSIGAYAGILPTSLPWFPNADKLGHALLIGGIGFFLDGALEHRRAWRSPSLAAILVLAVAGVEEYAQRLSPRRTSDIWDFAADAVGVIFFVWMSRRVDAAIPTQATPAIAVTRSGS